MTYTYIITPDNACEILKDKVKIDTVGPWDSFEGAEIWGQAICDKYNSEEYTDIDYPNDKPETGTITIVEEPIAEKTVVEPAVEETTFTTAEPTIEE